MKSLFKDSIYAFGWLAAFLVATTLRSPFFMYATTALFLWTFINAKHAAYIYPVVLLVILDYPGGFFWRSTDSIINIPPLGLSLTEVFSVLAVIKYGITLKKSDMIFRKPYAIYFMYFVFSILIGATLGMRRSGTAGEGYQAYGSVLRLLLLYPLFLTLPKIISSRRIVERIVDVFGIFVILNVFFQVYHVVTGSAIAFLLTGFGRISDTTELIRPVYGTFMCFITLLYAIYRIGARQGRIGWNYFMLVVSYGSVFLGATRGWILAFTAIIVVSWAIISKLKVHELVRNTAIPLILVFVLMQIHVVETQVEKSFERIGTLELIVEGDLTAGGTNARLTDRHYPVIQKFLERPVFGWGFSSVGYDTYDVHVGVQSLLMVGGIAGLVVVSLCLAWISFIILKRKQYIGFNRFSQGSDIFVVSLLGLLLISASSTDLFGFMAAAKGFHYNKIVFLAIYFSMLNAYLVQPAVCMTIIREPNAYV